MKITSVSVEEHQGNHRLQEKSHQNRLKDEKPYVLNKHQKTEIRLHSGSHFKHTAYRGRNSNCHVVCEFTCKYILASIT